MNIEHCENLLFKSNKPTKEYLELLRTTSSKTHIYPAIITETPYVLTEIGLPNGTISISKSVVNKAMGLNHQGNLQGHNVTMPFMRDIAKHIADPLLVMKSSDIAREKQKKDSFVIFSDFKINDKPIIIPFVLEPNADHLGIYKIVSVYDKAYVFEDRNIIEEAIKDKNVCYARSLEELEALANKKERDSYPLTVRADLISAPVSGAYLSTNNIATKEKLVNSYIEHSKETVFLYGGELSVEGSSSEYKVAESMLSKRGYKVISPYRERESLDIGKMLEKSTSVAYFISGNSRRLLKDTSATELARQANLPCLPIKDMLPESIINKRNLEIAHKDPATLMIGGLGL